MIGCCSHKFNLGVNEWIKQDPELKVAIEDLAALMNQASHCKAAALLRDYTYNEHGKELSAKQWSASKTRWTAVMDMIERYFKITSQLDKINNLEEYLLTKHQDTRLSGSRKHFEIFRSITVKFKRKAYPSMTCARSLI